MPPADSSDGGIDLHWNYDLEPENKRLKEQDFLENNSQISSVDFLQPRSVSTGLGLSFDNSRMASTGDSALLSLFGDNIDQELQHQDAEIDRFLKVQVSAIYGSPVVGECIFSILALTMKKSEEKCNNVLVDFCVLPF